MTQRRTAVAAACLASLGLTVAGALASPAAATSNTGMKNMRTAHLLPLNNSGTHGEIKVHVHSGTKFNARMRVYGATPNLPHAQHIHFGAQARHECPTAAAAGTDFRLSTADGLPAYGPIAVSLTTTGDAGPASGLAVDRMPVANAQGSYHYVRRHGQIVQDATTGTAQQVADAIRRGEGVVVVHGVDYNGNGKYDFDSAGVSELTPGQAGAAGVLPAEATDPAACGVLRH